MTLRERFEESKTFKFCNHFALKFDKKSNRYYSEFPTYLSDSIAMNAAWMMFQELNK